MLFELFLRFLTECKLINFNFKIFFLFGRFYFSIVRLRTTWVLSWLNIWLLSFSFSKLILNHCDLVYFLFFKFSFSKFFQSLFFLKFINFSHLIIFLFLWQSWWRLNKSWCFNLLVVSLVGFDFCTHFLSVSVLNGFDFLFFIVSEFSIENVILFFRRGRRSQASFSFIFFFSLSLMMMMMVNNVLLTFFFFLFLHSKSFLNCWYFCFFLFIKYSCLVIFFLLFFIFIIFWLTFSFDLNKFWCDRSSKF